MRFKLLLIWSFALILAGSTCAYAQEEISEKPLLEEPEWMNKVIVVDDFNDGTLANNLGGETQGDEEFPGGCIPTLTSEEDRVFGNSGYSLQLDYDVLFPGAFSFYWTRLGRYIDEMTGAVELLDLSGYRYLSFWLKSDGPIPPFSIEIHQDKDGDNIFLLGKDILSKIQIGEMYFLTERDGWRKALVPLDRYKKISDWSRVYELVFVFENKYQSGEGTIYIDDIIFGTSMRGKDYLTLAPQRSETEYFKLNGTEVESGFRLFKERENVFELKFLRMNPYLEKVSFEISTDKRRSWKVMEFFYGHHEDGVYTWYWKPDPRELAGEFSVRVRTFDVWGKSSVVAGPFDSSISQESTEGQ